MEIKQLVLTKESTNDEIKKLAGINPQLLLVFADRMFLETKYNDLDLNSIFKNTIIAGCSTAGEISADGVSEDTAILTAIHFDKTQLSIAKATHNKMQSSFDTGKNLAKNLEAEGLKAVLIYSVGLNINGSALLEGLHSQLPSNVIVAGGLAADKTNFEKTLVLTNEGVSDNLVTAIGLYGNVNVACSSSHGWEIFGPMRTISKCEGNILHELDGVPALEIYKKYLGSYAKDLPSSALLFPLMLIDKHNQHDSGVIRTILGINEQDNSLILAGTVYENAFVQMMHSNTEQLIDGAEDAAKKIPVPSHDQSSLAILISCVGRYLVMKDEADAEIYAVSEYLGEDCAVCGFYSYGEISTEKGHLNGQLHNQTMTVALLQEY